MGNSEVGHLNLGAGTIVKQDLLRIDEAVADGSFFDDDALAAACAAGRESGRLHLLGLVSHGGVHASMDHLRAIAELAEREGVPDVVLHAFTDGRDTLPDSGADALAQGRALAAARRDGHRPLLGDGPRPALGPHQARLRRARARSGGHPAGRQRRGCRARRLRARRDRRVHPADAGGGGGPHPRRRRGRLLQLPPRPRPPAHAGAGRAGLRRVRPRRRAARLADDADRVPGGLGLPDRLPAGAAERHARLGAGRARASPSCTWPRPRSTPT